MNKTSVVTVRSKRNNALYRTCIRTLQVTVCKSSHFNVFHFCRVSSFILDGIRK